MQATSFQVRQSIAALRKDVSFGKTTWSLTRESGQMRLCAGIDRAAFLWYFAGFGGFSLDMAPSHRTDFVGRKKGRRCENDPSGR